MRKHRLTKPFGRLEAFTMIELMVVISIIVTLIAVTLPSFTTLIQSSNYSSAINQTTAAMGSARAFAMKNRVQTAVAFLFDVRTQRYTLIILEEARLGTNGQLTEQIPDSDPKAYVFKPATFMTPIQLPKGTVVFGLTFSHVPDPLINPNVQDEPAIDADTWHWYAGEVYFNADDIVENPWIFPRNDALLFWQDGVAIAGGADLVGPWETLLDTGASDAVVDAVRHANSFMVQFSADGSIVTALTSGSRYQPRNAYIEYPQRPIDLESTQRDSMPYDSPNIFDPEIAPDEAESFDDFGRPIRILEGEANPEVILRPVMQLAIVDLNQLIRGTGVRMPWFLHPSTSLAPWPTTYDPDGRPDTGDEILSDDVQLDDLVSEVSAWIDQNAEIIGFDRYTGAAIRRIGQ